MSAQFPLELTHIQSEKVFKVAHFFNVDREKPIGAPSIVSRNIEVKWYGEILACTQDRRGIIRT